MKYKGEVIKGWMVGFPAGHPAFIEARDRQYRHTFGLYYENEERNIKPEPPFKLFPVTITIKPRKEGRKHGKA